MKATRFTTLMALGIALSFVTAGCHPQNMRKIPGTTPPPIDTNPFPPLPPPPIPQDTNSMMIELPPVPGHTGWKEDAEQLKSDTVHFAYDSSVVKASDKSKIAAVADYLKSNPQAAVRAEGNCDERGTEEYNRSLGERRALAAREEIVRLGIAPERVDTISYGEDKPAETGHNEAAWKQNRRADFILLTPPK
jgi:peptidoglycan-associated lipoprotein